MGVGKHAFESQDSCIGSNPCSEMLEMLQLVVYFSVDVSIEGIKGWMVIRSLDAGRSVLMPLHNFSSGFL